MAKNEGKTLGKVKVNGRTVQIVISAVGVILSLLLLFVSNVTMEMLCYLFCGMLITVGIIGIVGFFAKGFSLKLQEYGFTGGVLLVLLGLIGMLRTDQTTAGFLFFMGVGALVLGIMILQNTLTLKALNSRYWIASVVLTVLSLGINFFWLSNINALREAMGGNFVFWAVLVTSLMSFASLILTWLGKKEGPIAKAAPAAAEQADKEEMVDELLPEDAAAYTPVIQVNRAAPAPEAPAEEPDSAPAFQSYSDAVNAVNEDKDS